MAEGARIATDEAVDVADNLLLEIAKLGRDGVTGSTAVRALVKARGKEVDTALQDLLSTGMIARFKSGKFWCYHTTPEGQDIVEGMD